jgi:ankyrin repeat protein
MIDEFIVAACAPRDNHTAGTLADADAILSAHPEIADGGVYPAAVLGDDERVRRLVAEDPARAVLSGGPYGWDALIYLCFSRYLRLRGSDGFVRAAAALLDAGADPNTGFFEPDHQPAPTFESALYGAAGVAHHGGLTRLLLTRGADPNLGGEVAYHAAEGFDDAAMQAVVLSSRLADSGLTTMLHRKLDWTHLEGARWLLEHGADPNAPSAWGDRALHHSLGRDNALPLIELLLDFGADPGLAAPRWEDRTAVAVAARTGRADVLGLFRRRGFAVELEGDDAFYAALAHADGARARALVADDPGILRRVESSRPAVVEILAGAGNTAALALALDLGFPLSDGALPVAVWRGRTEPVRLLLARGAGVSDSVLSLAERALTEMSDWTPHKSHEIVDALRAAAAGA